ncbi:MAG: peptidylprolyl isomerase [Nanoarchaeota archaeon]
MKGKVKVFYTGKLDDGKVFDSNVGEAPLEFEIGSGMVIKGFDTAVQGMQVGEEKEVTISPEEGYGDVKKELVIRAPKANFPDEVKVGTTLGLKAPDGRQFPGKVIEITDKDIAIDFNHPLAGKTLYFTIKLEARE